MIQERHLFQWNDIGIAALFEQLSILMHSIEAEKKMRTSGEATEIVEA